MVILLTWKTTVSSQTINNCILSLKYLRLKLCTTVSDGVLVDMVRSFGLGIVGTRNVKVHWNERTFGRCKWEQVVTLRDTLNINKALKGSN